MVKIFFRRFVLIYFFISRVWEFLFFYNFVNSVWFVIFKVLIIFLGEIYFFLLLLILGSLYLLNICFLLIVFIFVRMFIFFLLIWVCFLCKDNILIVIINNWVILVY